MIKDLLPSLLESIRAEIKSKIGEDMLSLFIMGSVARGKFKTTLQDVDFVLVVQDEINCKKLEEIAVSLDKVCASSLSERSASRLVKW